MLADFFCLCHLDTRFDQTLHILFNIFCIIIYLKRPQSLRNRPLITSNIALIYSISIALKYLRCHEINQDMWLLTYKQIMFLQKKSLYLQKMVA